MGMDFSLNLGSPADIASSLGMGGLFGSNSQDKAKDLARYQNEQSLIFDANEFAQKMKMADEFGINKLAMLGVGNSLSAVPVSMEQPGSVGVGYHAADSVKVDPRDDVIKDNDVKISNANARTADANARIAESDAVIRSRAALSTGKPPAARISNDKAAAVIRDLETPKGAPFKLSNESVLPEQYNHGEAFTTLINGGMDPRLALSLSGVEFTNPTSWFTPLVELFHQITSPDYRFGTKQFGIGGGYDPPYPPKKGDYRWLQNQFKKGGD